MTDSLGVAVVPENTPARALVASEAEEMGATLLPVTQLADAALIVVDVADAAAFDLVIALRKREVRRLAWVIGILPASAPTASLPPELDDFVVASMLESLPARLRISAQRLATRRDAIARERDLSLLLDLNARFAAALDVEELLHEVTRRLADQPGISRVSLVVLDEERDTGIVVAASDDATLKNLRIPLQSYPEIREAVRTGRPVLVEDAPSHSLLEGVHQEVKARGIRAIAALPVAVRGKVLGVLLVRASRKSGLAPREVDFLATAAHAIAIALRNAKLLESVRGQTEREKSARIAAEERASELARYQSFFAGASDGIAVVDREGRVLLLNPAGSALFGVSSQEAEGRPLEALVHATSPERLRALVAAVAQGQVQSDVELTAALADGQERTLSVSVSPLRDGEASGVLSLRDVTASRRMAEELRETKEFLEKLIDSSVDAIIAADLRGNLILFNQGAERITGHPAKDALASLNAAQLYPAGGARGVMAKLRSSDYGGVGRLTVSREEIVTRTGERVPVNMTASMLYEDGREVATVGIFTDLRDRVQLERKLSDAENRLEESERNAVIVALAGTAAHELNQPLTSVMGYAELLKRKLKPEELAYRPVEIIYREAERMAEIVRKIGKITRYETKSYVGAARILDLDKATSHED